MGIRDLLLSGFRGKSVILLRTIQSNIGIFDKHKIQDKIRLNRIYFPKAFLYRIGTNNR